jgi:TonB family protein
MTLCIEQGPKSQFTVGAAMGFKTISCSVVLFLAAFAAIVSASGDGLDRAKSLYASAAYDEALTVLDQLSGTPAPDDSTSIVAYRVYCLLALDRQEEARTLIDRLLHQTPFFVPSADEAPPKIQTIFRDVRRATLPKIAKERYADAKAAFERKDPRTARQFDDLLALLDDPDLREWSAAADLRSVASAFRDLTKAVAVATPAAAPAPDVRPAEFRPQPPPEADITYTATDTSVIPPVSLALRMPQWNPTYQEASKDYRGVLRVVIDKSGAVESATMSSVTRPAYDQALIRAARSWKFQPAQKQGRPVRYAKVIEIHLAPGAPQTAQTGVASAGQP